MTRRVGQIVTIKHLSCHPWRCLIVIICPPLLVSLGNVLLLYKEGRTDYNYKTSPRVTRKGGQIITIKHL
jgi:hypothetical protein